jgi:hypothetical protein
MHVSAKQLKFVNFFLSVRSLSYTAALACNAKNEKEEEEKSFCKEVSTSKAFIELSLQNIIFRHLVAKNKKFFLRTSRSYENCRLQHNNWR